MSTVAPPELLKEADEWEALPDYPSAVFLGIVGDPAHQARGGYHIGIVYQSPGNYSVIRVDDKAPPGTWSRVAASATDMGLNLTDMKKCHARIKMVWENRKTDPRAKFFNAWNGWDGNGSPGRYDFVTGEVSTATDDHKKHIHKETKRKYANDPAARVAWISIVKGETVDQYLGKDEAMPFIENQADFDAAFAKTLLNPDTIQRLGAAVFKYDPGYRLGADGKPDSKLGVWPGISDDTYPPSPDSNGSVALGTAISSLLARLNGLITMQQKAIADESARDAQEAARDVALQEVIKAIQASVSAGTGTVVMTDEQLNLIAQKVIEAGDDAVAAVQRRLDGVAEALDNAGTALSKAAD